VNGDSSKVYLIAGLGNPGPKYKDTRHNIGFIVVQDWAKRLGIQLSGRRFKAKCGQAVLHERNILLLCPQTFMNLSGVSVGSCADFYRIVPENILVVHDDVDLPVGRVRLVKNGGAGGHKGVLSIFEYLGTHQFNRLKVGIGRPRREEPVDEFVLNPFYEEDRLIMEKVIELSRRACEIFVTEGIAVAMNRINRENLAQEAEGGPTAEGGPNREKR
jgi:PTH1 family peptidyl-tRNA hydrolase